MYAKDTVIPAWKMANDNRKINTPLIFHSDRAIQYACKEFTNYLGRDELVTRSMSRKEEKALLLKDWDNAVAESFFKSLKTEWVYKNHYDVYSDTEISIFKWIEAWYNRNRRH